MNHFSNSSESISSLFSEEQSQSSLRYFYHHKGKESNFKEFKINISENTHIPVNESFMILARTIVEKNLNNSEFNLEAFAYEMKISVSTLARRFRKYMIVTPNKFIISIRMKHARQMLQNNYYSVRNIAHNVGYEDRKYFCRCFRTEFGITPNEIRKRIK